MEDKILETVRRDVFEHPKPTIDLEYLYAIKKRVQEFADETNSQLKKNVYQNYSLFIESSREISALKASMKQLNSLLDQQQTALTKLLDQLNKTPIIHPIVDRPKNELLRLEFDNERNSEEEAEILPTWFTKSPDDFDVLIAQRNLREAVELAQRVRRHFEEYPKCCDDQSELKSKIENRLEELVNAISSELQPATDRQLQGGPRSSVKSIQLLRELGLSAKAVKLYLDQRSSVLRFVLSQQKVDSTTTLQFIRQICSIFLHNIIETCNEFKQAFELDRHVGQAIDESVDRLGIDIDRQSSNQILLFDLVRAIYCTAHPTALENGPLANNSSTTINNSSHDISTQILSGHQTENPLVISPLQARHQPVATSSVFYNLSTYASLTYWTVQEFENFLSLFRKHVFNNPQLSVAMICESIHHLRHQCAKMALYCEIEVSQLIERKLESDIRQVIETSGRKLIEVINKLNKEEQWQPQLFQNKAQLTRFFEEMNDVDLKTMPNYIFDDLKLHFTACKTSFARYFLITVNGLAKLVCPGNKDHVDAVLAKAFELEMESVVEALKKQKVSSNRRFILGNSNFLLDKVILVADAQYTSITSGLKCQKLVDLRAKYQSKVKPFVNM